MKLRCETVRTDGRVDTEVFDTTWRTPIGAFFGNNRVEVRITDHLGEVRTYTRVEEPD